jgi:alkaline phosphatase D
MKRPGHRLSRRRFLETGLALGGSVAAVPALAAGRLHAQAPAIVRSEAQRPALPQGVATGDAGTHGAVVWSRTDRPARMFVEYSTTDRFPDVRRVRGPAALAVERLHGRLVLTDLPPGQRIFYRVTFQDLSDLRTWSAPVVGQLPQPVPARRRRTVTLAWSADTAGQGWGINPDWGGCASTRRCGAWSRTFHPLRRHHLRGQPDQAAEVTLEDGTIWKNVVTEAKRRSPRRSTTSGATTSTTCSTSTCGGSTPRWRRSSSGTTTRSATTGTRRATSARDERYQVKSAALLAARARQAFLEFNPLPLHGPDPERIHRTVPLGDLAEVFALDLRSYRGPNSENRQPALTDAARLFGAAQMDWLKARSRPAAQRGRSSPATSPSASSSATARRSTRRSPMVTMARRSEERSRWPGCCVSSATNVFATSCGSPATCTTAPRTTTIPRARGSPSSTRSGSSWQARSTRGRSALERSTRPSGPRCASTACRRA